MNKPWRVNGAGDRRDLGTLRLASGEGIPIDAGRCSECGAVVLRVRHCDRWESCDGVEADGPGVRFSLHRCPARGHAPDPRADGPDPAEN